jgi:hypothetical protein
MGQDFLIKTSFAPQNLFRVAFVMAAGQLQSHA